MHQTPVLLPVVTPRTADSREVIGGRSALRGLLGSGGSGSVRAAHDLLLERQVAVKVFAGSADDPVLLRQAQREARLAAGFDHPSLVTVFDAGIDEPEHLPPRVHLVMERMRGGDLRARLRIAPLTPLQIARLALDLTRGLQHLHRRGLLHRDLKPANVLLGADAPLRGKLADFGIASVIGAPRTGISLGTVGYISPEQVVGCEASTASDVDALGLVLLEGVTGMREFPGDAIDSAARRIGCDVRVPGAVPRALAALLRSMVRREPTDRAGPGELIDGFATVAGRGGRRGLGRSLRDHRPWSRGTDGMSLEGRGTASRRGSAP